MGGRELLCAAARAMRHVLVDAARRHRALKRNADGAAALAIWPDDGAPQSPARDEEDLLALDRSLYRLGEIDSELLTMVELRFFGGLSEDQTARYMGVSTRTVRRSWRFARAWLAAQLAEGDRL
jgi:RNA polymerase sigma factor (TIGR02999 family)